MTVVPLTLKMAGAFIRAHHRHHKPPVGMKFAIGVRADDGTLVGVATAGRPVARAFDDGLTLEVNRTCTDGTPHVNSMLYGAVWRAGKAMGYRRCLTYIQEGETGASLRAVGWCKVKDLPPRGNWATCSVARRAQRDATVQEFVGRQLWDIHATGRCDAPANASAR